MVKKNMPGNAVVTHGERRRVIVEEFRESRLTQEEFCRQRGLKLCTFQSWLYRDGKGKKAKRTFQTAGKAPFLPIRVISKRHDERSIATSGEPVDVMLCSGHRIRVTRGFDAETLKQVVLALERL